MAEGRAELGGVICIRCVRNQLANTRHHSAHLRKTVDGLVCPLRQIDDVLAIEQAFNEPIQFLEANEAILAQVDGGRLRGRAGQPERLAALLMPGQRSEEHTSDLQSLMRISYAGFCLKNKKTTQPINTSSLSIKSNIKST